MESIYKAYSIRSEDNCPRPTASDDFIFRSGSVIQKTEYKTDNYKIRPHGIGMQTSIDDTKIEFDFYPNEEFNGLNAWWSYGFILSE